MIGRPRFCQWKVQRDFWFKNGFRREAAPAHLSGLFSNFPISTLFHGVTSVLQDASLTHRAHAAYSFDSGAAAKGSESLRDNHFLQHFHNRATGRNSANQYATQKTNKLIHQSNLLIASSVAGGRCETEQHGYNQICFSSSGICAHKLLLAVSRSR